MPDRSFEERYAETHPRKKHIDQQEIDSKLIQMNYTREKIEKIVLYVYKERCEYVNEMTMDNIYLIYDKETKEIKVSDCSACEKGEVDLDYFQASSQSAYNRGFKGIHIDEFLEWFKFNCKDDDIYKIVVNAPLEKILGDIEWREIEWEDFHPCRTLLEEICYDEYVKWDKEIALIEFIYLFLDEIVDEIIKNLIKVYESNIETKEQ